MTITLAGASCAVNNSTAASLTIAGITNPGAGTYTAGSFSIATSKDTIPASPSSGVTINATDDYSYAAGTGTGTAPAAGSGLDGTTITLAANTFTEPGYTFAGWNDGSATYDAGSSYLLASNGSPIVLTATWTANATDDLLLRRGHRHGHRPGRGQRPRRHHRHLGRQHLHRAGLRLRRVESTAERHLLRSARPTP